MNAVELLSQNLTPVRLFTLRIKVPATKIDIPFNECIIDSINFALIICRDFGPLLDPSIKLFSLAIRSRRGARMRVN